MRELSFKSSASEGNLEHQEKRKRNRNALSAEVTAAMLMSVRMQPEFECKLSHLFTCKLGKFPQTFSCQFPYLHNEDFQVVNSSMIPVCPNPATTSEQEFLYNTEIYTISSLSSQPLNLDSD
uniref:Uncharacterized protein n=1 Tax=Molossus molossus TaxID=27622 RepID=A0A7J8DUA3_MOLMO|nr:hypothetical protein HJG59_009161 [Molossus molossus]